MRNPEEFAVQIYKGLIDKKETLAIVGLGYVGFPLAEEFGKIVQTIGFDLNRKRIADLQNSLDTNQETSSEVFNVRRCLLYVCRYIKGKIDVRL